MSITVVVPTALRQYAGGNANIEVEGTTVGEALDELVTTHLDLKAHLYNKEGNLRSFVNLYLGDEDIRYLQKEETPVDAGQTLSIVPSIAGGR